MKKRKKWIWIISGVAVLLLIINFAAAIFFYNLAIERNVKDFLSGNADLEVEAETMDVLLDGDWRDWSDEQSFETWHQTSYDGLNLQGYYLEAEQPTNKVVIFAHGYLGRGKDMSLYGQHYYEDLGYNIFTADMRGHGESEGDYIGFGWHDRLDLIQWMDKVIDRVGDDAEIVLHGVSMGGSTVLMTSGEELPDNVKAVVADASYTDVNDLFSYHINRMFHLPSFPFIPSTSLVTQIRAGYGLKEASALDQVAKAEVPILYIHGKEDIFVPTEMTEELYENTKSEKELLLVDGASHGESFVKEEELYKETLDQFLERFVHD
ncbi:alpha/beta hydrolase [Oceanobacillus sp. J11TS1]|uniref:alpha/beta hydrolase n=1 Tax=Oceanobacillus sp. J11TS1 TaxID=2807191 RepID=UPI001B2E0FFF|nr:alpha/beta hydrolase [Oceanobacillus sp. J11TS1]GIO21571.1 alpha/beta hydrolase [Oceanobacillus sp. J11TS1]